MPPVVPRCRRMGGHCRSLRVVLRVGAVDAGPASDDHEATWLLGHTERIRFGTLRNDGAHLYVTATLEVPCRYFELDPDGAATCRAHGYDGRAPPEPDHPDVTQRRLGGEVFEYVDHGRVVRGPLASRPSPARELPVLSTINPCAGAPCRTADHRRGASCCRDLQVEILCSERAKWLEALIRSRRPPFLCKVTREGRDSLGAEMISACAYLADDGVACALHGRVRPDGRPAKPDLCSEWPKPDDNMHPGCVYAGNRAIGDRDLGGLSRTQPRPPSLRPVYRA